MNIRTVLFDLDGTLADTAPDLAHTLNTLLVEEGRAALAYETIRPEVSHGAGALVRLGFGDVANEEFERLRRRFLALYAENLVRETRLFPGMDELLSELKRRGLNWGIVTNKPAFLTEPLMARLGLSWPPASIVSGDSTGNRKPHPRTDAARLYPGRLRTGAMPVRGRCRTRYRGRPARRHADAGGIVRVH